MAGEDEQSPAGDSNTERPAAAPTDATDRSELLNRARTFLRSPQVSDEDIWAKRKFLTEKGLTEPEIDGLLRELPPRAQVPQVPPRTYPQPPPSRLPDLLAGIIRITGWIAGASALLLLVYYRFILPRLARSYDARCRLVRHQKGLVARLNASLAGLKDAQEEAYADLPRPDPFEEPPEYRVCRSVDDVLAVCEDEVPEYTLLRCALGEFAAEGTEASTSALFERLRSKIPSLDTPEGLAYQERLWRTLTSSSPFTPSDLSHPESCTWTYTPPPPRAPSALAATLSALHSALPEPAQTPRYQHTQQALADFTGYLTTHAYASATFLQGSDYGFSETGEDEVKREIRALKGLVLNRQG
ncbi:hypothetical protein NEOLEDRAFT_1145036 [Neolentinus lepideus HHB14362 ss-1]|uniref:Peroxisomal membrane protein PEX14 n=1 Tax=Neolentinus lepideus HHB14362 ss-1 TaxID=1314782 RepID=A0A165V6W4_9AGAM|nr:hypothetical protein NEOLEDRAFT_1145036 [Neolentinus lepideus HHB14362 ss-1]